MIFLQKAGLYLTFHRNSNAYSWRSELTDPRKHQAAELLQLLSHGCWFIGSISNLSHSLQTKSAQEGCTGYCVADHFFSKECFWPLASFLEGEKSVIVKVLLVPLLSFPLLAKLYRPTGVINLAFNHLLDDLQEYLEKWKLSYKPCLLSLRVMLVGYYWMEQVVW